MRSPTLPPVPHVLWIQLHRHLHLLVRSSTFSLSHSFLSLPSVIWGRVFLLPIPSTILPSTRLFPGGLERFLILAPTDTRTAGILCLPPI